MVLRDGDPVPAVPGSGGQPSVADSIKDYVDKTTTPYTVNLNPKQAIFAIELGTKAVTYPACDYQDLVVLVTVADSLIGLDAEGFAVD